MKTLDDLQKLIGSLALTPVQGIDVGYSGKAAQVLRHHNKGEKIGFKHKLGAYTQYVMPKREFLGWSPEMVKQVEQSVVDQYLKFQGA